MRINHLLVLTCALFLVALVVSPAQTKTIEDRAGDGFTLDLASARARHHERQGREWWTFRLETHSSYGNGELQKVGSRQHCPLSVRVDVDFEGDSDVNVCVYSSSDGDGYELHAPVTSGRLRWDENRGGNAGARVWRADPRTIKFEVYETDLRKGGLEAMRWAARAVSQDDEGSTAFDFAPGRKRLVSERS